MTEPRERSVMSRCEDRANTSPSERDHYDDCPQVTDPNADCTCAERERDEAAGWAEDRRTS